MARVRRATHVFFRCRDARLLDVEELLRGRMSIGARTEVVAVSLLTGEESPLAREELDALVDLPSEWTDVDELPEQARPLVAGLARVAPSQANLFAFAVLEPELPRDLYPWVRLEGGTPVADEGWIRSRIGRQP
jgi:hypothetical protein